MSLNNIELSPAVMAGLYPQSLVQTGDAPVIAPGAESIAQPPSPAVEMTAKEPVGDIAWKSLGDNKKKILVVVNYPETPYLPDEDLSFLTKMLTACKLSLGDVAIINQLHYTGIGSKEILTHFTPSTVFLFGIEPLAFGLPVNFPAYQLQTFSGSTFLYTPSLEERHRDELFKSKLWVCLKRIFSI